MTISITSYIIEDELQHGKIIAENIQEFSDRTSAVVLRPKIITEFISFYENLDDFIISDNNLFIIDIHLKTYFTGIELAKKIRALNKNVFIIFLTSDETKGIQIINSQIAPLGYVVKQFLSNNLFKEELFSLLQKLSTELLTSLINGTLLSFRSGHNQLLLHPSEIYYFSTIKGVRGRVVIKTEKSELTCTESIASIKKKVEQLQFFAVFKSYVINLTHIRSYSRIDGTLIFDQGSELYVGTKIVDKISKQLRR